MQKQSLNGQWQLHILSGARDRDADTGEGNTTGNTTGNTAGNTASTTRGTAKGLAFAIPTKPFAATIPGSVYSAMLEGGLMLDPYDRDNELNALSLMDNDFEFSYTFMLEAGMQDGDVLILRFDGLDTLAEISLNGYAIGHTKNMHRTWEYNVYDYINAGENELVVTISSPVKYIKERNAEIYAGGSRDAIEGYPHLRKAHCMFGWDWGPRLPDAGIFREVSLTSYRKAKIDSVYITQEHSKNSVKLNFTTAIRETGAAGERQVEVDITPPFVIGSDATKQSASGKKTSIVITKPYLWWPNGYGEQHLYTVYIRLLDEKGQVLDTWERRIGLRTIGINTGEDKWGTAFAHEVNGLKIFAMGANYIPEDNLLSRVTPERTRQLLEDAQAAHHNCIRVWGGGYYPDDFFYDLCDELGLIVWQDFMFACACYELDDEFERNITLELRDNIRRLRHHACLGLWCGNNEMEAQMIAESWRPSPKQKYDYIKIFEQIVPKLVQKEDPATFYWPSSPSSGGNYDEPQSETRGDAHYWGVWHGNEPFAAYRQHYFRYLSEFGFQSFPALSTIESFTEEGDRNIFSYVMEMHQRNSAANGKIMAYLSATYRYPTDLARLAYASQLLQAEAIRYGIEHNRRHRGRCMGTLVWQLNDIWPAASWSGIDYYGRWKALHYIEKRAFAPVMISCEEMGEMQGRPFPIAEPAPFEKSFRLHVANETAEEVRGTVKWSLRGPESGAYPNVQGEKEIKIPAFAGVWLDKVEVDSYDGRRMHLAYSFVSAEGLVVSSGTVLFTPPKYYQFADPRLSCTLKGKFLTVSAEAYAKNVEILAVGGDVWLSDNYFDMEEGEVMVEILRGDARKFMLRSVYDI
jgi:beta-mannosidase